MDQRRLGSVDTVRGAVMVLMALDHVRDFVTSHRLPPENLARGSAALFATRWVTHFCAPAFFLLAGMGIGIAMNRGRRPAEMSRYLVTRGLWLFVLELIITPIGWRFSLDLLPAFALVLWALGWAMIIMAGLVHLARAVVAVISLAAIAGHNAFDAVRPEALGTWGPLWTLLHVPGFLIPDVLLAIYPIVPWFAVMALGWVLAGAFTWEPERRRRLFIGAGVGAFALFVALRAGNFYGNPFPWAEQRSAALTFASFFNVLKYPPSLHFLLMTLGPVLVALALTERVRGRFAEWLQVYGRVPLFFYVAHIFVVHALGVMLALVQGGELRRIPAVDDPASIPTWFGVGLPGVYVAWALAVLIMYWPCRRFAELKATRDDWWLRYL